ncbi:MAG: transglycosylase SLT domain-containing protein [Planctomycetes bacterium]|nr:transglycosylase SLT domain-containing protein [Planctomycetota bacterium]
MELLSLYAALAVGWSVLLMPRTAGTPPEDPMDRLLDAIAVVESRDNPGAVGDHGRALGVYQIHRSYWAEGTGLLGVTWKYGDARDPQKARQVVRAYLSYYGRGKSLLDMARIHNGGPRGCEKAATLAYARKIEQVLNSGEPGPRQVG